MRKRKRVEMSNFRPSSFLGGKLGMRSFWDIALSFLEDVAFNGFI